MTNEPSRVQLNDVSVSGASTDRAALLATIERTVAETGTSDRRTVESAVAAAVKAHLRAEKS
ncbi:hypothetical protein [Kribbella kalugense]|uniref:Uncharacterized protein n=1 Tax=Kribbella kalugense TaxID=2512221 RepID=A0A4R7ZYQ0_9ACTN|nr:hypothetical protein [Kribbella kalugense]TDW22078.1 hypothetical protein EV650_0910 [Kribbella kalugense]